MSVSRLSCGFDPGYYADLFELENTHFWFRARNRSIIWALGKYFPDSENFLEIGCGTGFVLSGIEQAFGKIQLSGTELFEEGLTFAAKRVGRANLFQMDARQIPYTEQFDLVGAFDVLEHIDEDELVLQQIHKALKPGGGILVTVPQHPALWSSFDDFSCHVRRYRRRELFDKLDRAGFDRLGATSFFTLLFPAMLAARLLKGKKPETVQEALKIPVTLNNIFEKVCAIESALIRTGFSFPIGGSLLVAARKK